ncbi:hypothetical protein [Methylomonas sp. LWB]|uniref:hypothetical protein n=1 Tax=Methylomonas sp. LWB TaxID=1905845 RepID=UPI000A64467D|nr:hypothetical protein [Methylomonas sp. LWB]
MTLHIASMMPDRALEDSAIAKAITKVAIDLAGLREHHLQKRMPVVDIVFMLPSRVEKADFDGLRLHSFDESMQVLRVESAVPEKMVASSHAERYVVAVMLDAIEAAGDFFAERSILFDAPEHLAMVLALFPDRQHAIN